MVHVDHPWLMSVLFSNASAVLTETYAGYIRDGCFLQFCTFHLLYVFVASVKGGQDQSPHLKPVQVFYGGITECDEYCSSVIS